MYNKILKDIIFPVTDMIRGRSTIKKLHELKETQWWSRKELQELQNEKVQRLVWHAYKNVPYYRRILKERCLLPQDIRTVEDLQKLPVLRKKDIRKHFSDQLIAKNIDKRELSMSRTAGSTGEPLFFYLDKNSLSYCSAAFYRFLEWMGLDIGDQIIKMWAGPELGRSRESFIARLKERMLRVETLNSLRMGEDRLEVYAAKIISQKPKLLYGYGSSIFMLAEYMIKKKISIPHDMAVTTTSEVLQPEQREQIELAFNTSIFDLYGCGEINSIACECEKHKGLHIALEHVIVEVINEHDGSQADGVGSLLITDLENYSMPLIRYMNGDRSRFLKGGCSCGRDLPLIDHIDGRTYDIVIGTNGNSIYGGFFNKIVLGKLDWISRFKIKQYQVVQETEKDISIKIMSEIRPGREDERALVKIIQDYLGEMSVEFRYVKDIPPGKSGKRRFVISKVKDNRLLSS